MGAACTFGYRPMGRGRGFFDTRFMAGGMTLGSAVPTP
jgi:hypothetical protein